MKRKQENSRSTSTNLALGIVLAITVIILSGHTIPGELWGILTLVLTGAAKYLKRQE